MHNLAIHLQKMGHEVHVITWWGNWIQVRGKLPYPVHPLLPRSYTEKDRKRLEGKGEWSQWVPRQVLGYQRLFSFDVFQIHLSNPLGPLCVSSLHRAGIPVIMRCVGGDLLFDEAIRYGARRNPVLGKVLAMAITQCDRVTASSGLMEAGYLEIGVSPERITRIPNGVSVKNIASIHPPGSELRRSHGIPADALLLLTVGRNVNFKGYSFIPKIMQRLQEIGVSAWWAVVGAEAEALQSAPGVDELRGRLLTIAPVMMVHASERRYDRLHQLPPEVLIQWYKTADLYVHPAILEPFGNIIVESMAAGLPLVVTEGTGASDCVEKARCGLVARTGDVEDIADKIRQLIENKPLRDQMAVRAREGAKEYDWPIIARKYAEVYEKAIGDKRGPR